MKKIIKITLALLIIAMTMSLFSCTAIERLLFGGDPYSFSDIVMTQTGVSEFRIDFTVDCGNENVKIYFTEGSRLSDKTPPIEVAKDVVGRKARFSFTEELIHGENYYLWVVNGEKQAKISIPGPSMFPDITVNDDGSATFNFRYTYGTAWDAICDPTGKAVYKSSSPVFDDTATLICDQIDITNEYGPIPADQFDEDSYYFSVSTAKDGLLKIISRPVMVYDKIVDQIDNITAKLTGDLKLQLNVTIPESAAISSELANKLQLIVKKSEAKRA